MDDAIRRKEVIIANLRIQLTQKQKQIQKVSKELEVCSKNYEKLQANEKEVRKLHREVRQQHIINSRKQNELSRLESNFQSRQASSQQQQIQLTAKDIELAQLSSELQEVSLQLQEAKVVIDQLKAQLQGTQPDKHTAVEFEKRVQEFQTLQEAQHAEIQQSQDALAKRHMDQAQKEQQLVAYESELKMRAEQIAQAEDALAKRELAVQHQTALMLAAAKVKPMIGFKAGYDGIVGSLRMPPLPRAGSSSGSNTGSLMSVNIHPSSNGLQLRNKPPSQTSDSGSPTDTQIQSALRPFSPEIPRPCRPLSSTQNSMRAEGEDRLQSSPGSNRISNSLSNRLSDECSTSSGSTSVVDLLPTSAAGMAAAQGLTYSKKQSGGRTPSREDASVEHDVSDKVGAKKKPGVKRVGFRDDEDEVLGARDSGGLGSRRSVEVKGVRKGARGSRTSSSFSSSKQGNLSREGSRGGSGDAAESSGLQRSSQQVAQPAVRSIIKQGQAPKGKLLQRGNTDGSLEPPSLPDSIQLATDVESTARTVSYSDLAPPPDPRTQLGLPSRLPVQRETSPQHQQRLPTCLENDSEERLLTSAVMQEQDTVVDGQQERFRDWLFGRDSQAQLVGGVGSPSVSSTVLVHSRVSSDHYISGVVESDIFDIYYRANKRDGDIQRKSQQNRPVSAPPNHEAKPLKRSTSAASSHHPPVSKPLANKPESVRLGSQQQQQQQQQEQQQQQLVEKFDSQGSSWWLSPDAMEAAQQGVQDTLDASRGTPEDLVDSDRALLLGLDRVVHMQRKTMSGSVFNSWPNARTEVVVDSGQGRESVMSGSMVKWQSHREGSRTRSEMGEWIDLSKVAKQSRDSCDQSGEIEAGKEADAQQAQQTEQQQQLQLQLALQTATAQTQTEDKAAALDEVERENIFATQDTSQLSEQLYNTQPSMMLPIMQDLPKQLYLRQQQPGSGAPGAKPDMLTSQEIFKLHTLQVYIDTDGKLLDTMRSSRFGRNYLSSSDNDNKDSVVSNGQNDVATKGSEDGEMAQDFFMEAEEQHVASEAGVNNSRLIEYHLEHQRISQMLRSQLDILRGTTPPPPQSSSDTTDSQFPDDFLSRIQTMYPQYTTWARQQASTPDIPMDNPSPTPDPLVLLKGGDIGLPPDIEAITSSLGPHPANIAGLGAIEEVHEQDHGSSEASQTASQPRTPKSQLNAASEGKQYGPRQSRESERYSFYHSSEQFSQRDGSYNGIEGIVGVYETRPVSQALMANVALQGQLRRSMKVADITEGVKSDEDEDEDEEETDDSEVWQDDAHAELSYAMVLNERLSGLERRATEGAAQPPKVKRWIQSIFGKRRRGGDDGHAGWKSLPRLGSSPGEGSRDNGEVRLFSNAMYEGTDSRKGSGKGSKKQKKQQQQLQ